MRLQDNSKMDIIFRECELCGETGKIIIYRSNLEEFEEIECINCINIHF